MNFSARIFLPFLVFTSFVIMSLACGSTATDENIMNVDDSPESVDTASNVIRKTPSPNIKDTVVIGTVNKNANLRIGPGTDFEIVGSAAANQTVEIINENKEGDWLRIADGSWIAAFLVDSIGEVTPTPYPTQVPLRSTPFELSEFSSLVLKSVVEVESVLGAPIDIAPFYAGATVAYSGKGEYRDYYFNEYWFTASYDSSGVLRGIQVIDGLSSQDYKIDEWPEVLAMFGLPDNVSPDITAPMGIHWDNLNRMKVSLLANGIQSTSSIWTIQIFAQE